MNSENELYQTNMRMSSTWQDGMILEAIEAVKSGVMNALQASKELKVPHSTLYYKVKKLNIKTPPYNITPAIEAVISGVMNPLQASKEFKVPHSTLYRKFKKLDIASTLPYNITPAIEAVKSGVMNCLNWWIVMNCVSLIVSNFFEEKHYRTVIVSGSVWNLNSVFWKKIFHTFFSYIYGQVLYCFIPYPKVHPISHVSNFS